MSKQMPSMPGLNKSNENEKELETPSHDEKPKYINPELDNNSVISIPKFPSKGIEVVAIRKGFYNQKRIEEGEKFIVSKKENLGEWMKCVDPALEKERINFFITKKAKK